LIAVLVAPVSFLGKLVFGLLHCLSWPNFMAQFYRGTTLPGRRSSLIRE
jgi:hypothetical protein